MAAVGDYVGAVQDRLWAIFEADTVWAGLILSGNRIKRTGADPFPEKSAKEDGDFPEASIRPTGFNSEGPTAGTGQTFGTMSGAGSGCDFICRSNWEYEIESVWPDLRTADATLFLTRTEYLLWQAGPKLALAGSGPLRYVESWGPLSGGMDETADGAAVGSLRLVQRVVLPVTFRLHRADVLG